MDQQELRISRFLTFVSTWLALVIIAKGGICMKYRTKLSAEDQLREILARAPQDPQDTIKFLNELHFHFTTQSRRCFESIARKLAEMYTPDISGQFSDLCSEFNDTIAKYGFYLCDTKGEPGVLTPSKKKPTMKNDIIERDRLEFKWLNGQGQLTSSFDMRRILQSPHLITLKTGDSTLAVKNFKLQYTDERGR